MTREDIEQLNILEPYCFETDLEEKWYNIGLKHGLEIADEEPNLERIWHDAGEEPKENSKIVIVDTKGEFWIIDYFSEYFYERGLYGWDFCKENYNLKIWAYIDDLLPKGCKK